MGGQNLAKGGKGGKGGKVYNNKKIKYFFRVERLVQEIIKKLLKAEVSRQDCKYFNKNYNLKFPVGRIHRFLKGRVSARNRVGATAAVLLFF